MKKLMMAAVALICMTLVMSLSSCANDDNPVDVPGDNVPLADAIKLHTAPQSFRELDTHRVLPLYIVVTTEYEVDGEKKYYDLSQITEVSSDISNDYFDIDASQLAEHGYIKLTPTDEDFIDQVDMAYVWSEPRVFTLKNKKGETYKQEVTLSYLNKNEFDLEKTCKQSELGDGNEYILDVTKPYGLFDWTFKRYGDVAISNMVYLFSAKLQEDGLLHIITDGYVTEPDDPNTLDYTFKRLLVGSPNPILPEGEGVMINFRIKLKLHVTE